MAVPIWQSEFFTMVVLPFVLVFVIVFAILQRTQILGKDKKQIDAIVSFIFALIFIGVPSVVGVAVSIIPIIALIIIILLAFMLMWGFVGGKTPVLNKGLRITIGIFLLIAMTIIIMWATNTLSFFSKVPYDIWSALILVGFVVAVFSVVLSSKKPEEREEVIRKRKSRVEEEE